MIDYGTSSIYTKAEMDAAIELIKKEFSTWDGCELHSISYSADEFQFVKKLSESENQN